MSENEQQKKSVEITATTPKPDPRWKLGSAAAPVAPVARVPSLPTPAEFDTARMQKDGRGGAAGEYTFKGYSNFAVFCRINRDKLFLDGDSGAIDGIKNQVDLFLVTQKNTIGGCGCSKGKRREAALKMYVETVNMLLKNEEVQNRVVALLNGSSAVTFLKGEKTGASSRESQQPIAVIKI